MATDRAVLKAPYERLIENAVDYDHLLVAHNTSYYGSTLKKLGPVEYEVYTDKIKTRAYRLRDKHWRQILRYPVLLALSAREEMTANYYFPTTGLVEVPSSGPHLKAILDYFSLDNARTLFEQYTYIESKNPWLVAGAKSTRKTITQVFNEDVSVLSNLNRQAPNEVTYPNDGPVNALYTLLEARAVHSGQQPTPMVF